MDRRTFLNVAASAALVASTRSRVAWAADRRPLGLQLFTVMALLEQDFDGLLKTIANIGYKEVETIGAFGRDPAYVRAALDRHGLVSPSQHLMPDSLYRTFLQFTRKEVPASAIEAAWTRDMALGRMKTNVSEAIARAKVLGQKYVVLQIIWPEQMKSRERLDEFCRVLDMAGGMCADAGLGFNFHNHSAEFTPLDGYVPYDVILESTNHRTVKMELDIYWAVHAGQDPVALFERNIDRFVQCHVKDSTASGDFATVGKGVIDIPRVVSAAEKAGVRHFYVEYDRADDPLAVVKDAYSYLNSLP